MTTNETKPSSFDEKQSQLIALFNEVKNIYSSNRIDKKAEDRLREIIKIFISFNNEKGKEGIIYTIKGLAIIYHRRTFQTDNISDKIEQLEQAHDTINDAVTQARKFKKLQPSLLKHQVAIKSDLAELLHTTGDHHNANLLEKSAFAVVSEMMELFPDYAEGSYTAVSTSYKKLKWLLGKMLWDLKKTEGLLNKPTYTKHRADEDELLRYFQDIEKMKYTINQLLSITIM